MNILRELWDRRALIWSFALSDLKIRYRNSILGFFWTLLEPLLIMFVLYMVFTNIFKSQIEHFGLYLLIGIIMWNMFSRGTEMAMNSILAKGNLLTHIYFPTEIPAISSVITSSLMLFFEIVVFLLFMIFFQFVPPATIVFLPLVLMLEIILVLGISLPLSVLNVRYRDIQFIWRVVLQIGFFVTPIFYKLDILPDNIQNILKYSPIAQIIDMGHDLSLNNKIPSSESITITIVITLSIFAVGYAIFYKSQKRIVEEL
ncbi:MAG: ABC transporter permease [Nitrososphaera sp.]|jgi:lipopolysaccharide transport system permease protein